MAFGISLMGSSNAQTSSSRPSREPVDDDYDDSSSNTESEAPKPKSYSHGRPRLSSSTVMDPSGPSFLLPSLSSNTSTPVPSRSVSPLPQFYSSAQSSCTSDDESEPSSPLMGNRPLPSRVPWWRKERRRWWSSGPSPGRFRGRRNRNVGWLRSTKKSIRRLIRHPFFPSQPITIVSLEC